MYKPDQKGTRILLAHLCEKYHEDISVITTRYETITCPNTGEVLCVLTHYDILFKG